MSSSLILTRKYPAKIFIKIGISAYEIIKIFAFIIYILIWFKIHQSQNSEDKKLAIANENLLIKVIIENNTPEISSLNFSL